MSGCILCECIVRVVYEWVHCVVCIVGVVCFV